MGRGFFQGSKLRTTKAPASLVPKCGACGLFEHCHSPKMAPTGKGRKSILILGEFPSEEDDEYGKHFTGPAGALLEESLARSGIVMRRDCHLSNAIICHPKEGVPSSDKIDWCRPNLVKTIKQLQPELIIPLGSAAVQSLLRSVYREDDIGSISRWAGWKIPCQKLNTWIAPTFHPNYILRSDKNPVPRMLFHQHIRQAVEGEGRPFDEVPDYKSQVEKILSPEDAAEAIRGFLTSRIVAFDYETTTLKPEYEGASIICCSISNGHRTICYPWLGDAVEATRELLRSPVGKIASNLKFEERWTRFEFGRGVRNWHWDTMVAAHCLDNRPNITSIKFQAFIHLGAESYDDHIKPFLRVKGQKMNRIKQDVDLDQLLTYCGLDSLLEFRVARKQMKEIGYPLPEQKET